MKQVTNFYYSLIFLQFGSTTIYSLGSHTNLCNLNEREIENSGDKHDHNNTCDCHQTIYCSVFELSGECNQTFIRLNDDYLNKTNIGKINCNLIAMESQLTAPIVEVTNIDHGGVEAVIFVDSHTGKFKLICTVLNSSTESYEVNKSKILQIHPTKALVDKEIELTLLLSSNKRTNTSDMWCHVQTPDCDTKILSLFWITEKQVQCSTFIPEVPGVFRIAVDTLEGNNMEEKIFFEVFGEAPIAGSAEYGPDFKTISIYFDQNVEILSNCGSAFSEDCQSNFGKDFSCEVRGNVLNVIMGDDFKPINRIHITSENKICRKGAQCPRFSPFALPLTLQVSDKKILYPNLSLYVLSPTCHHEAKQAYMNIEVLPLMNVRSDNYYKVYSAKRSGKSQRENLMAWRTVRQFQNKFLSKLINFRISSTDILPSFENFQSLERFLEIEENPVIDLVTTDIKSFPAPSAIVAEVNVTICRENVPLFRYKWRVNDEMVLEEGKLLVVKNPPPGKYLITCFIETYNSSDIIGQGWTTTEIHGYQSKLVIFPSEITTGSMNGFSLYAVEWFNKSLSWNCKATNNTLCFTTKQELVTDVIDVNSKVLYIPPGTLPIGSYIWTLGNSERTEPARVYIKSGEFPTINVNISSMLVTSFEEVVLNCAIKKWKGKCRARWSSVRQKGFDYFSLETAGIFKDKELPFDKLEENISLIIPPSSARKKGLQPYSSYMFQLQVICQQSDTFSTVKVPISVNDPPHITPLVVEPKTGKALITLFTIFGPEAEDSIEDYPLMFEWSYIDPCNVEILIRRGLYRKFFTTHLPPGNLKLSVKVCDIRGACTTTSSSEISVSQSADVSSENFERIFSQIRYLMASGDTLEAFGLAITVFKTLALTAETEIREKAYATIEEVIQRKAKDFLENIGKNPNLIQTSLEFYNQASAVVKYFRKGSDIVRQLNAFKNSISKYAHSKRVRRNAGDNKLEFEDIFKLHSVTLDRNDTIQNRMKLQNDVRKYMAKICSNSLMNSFIIESRIVNISCLLMNPQKEPKKVVTFFVNNSFTLELFGKFLKQRSCLAVAQFSRDLLGNTNMSRLTQVYEVQLIKNERFFKPTKNDSTSLTMKFHIKNPPNSGIDCMIWTKNRGWSLKCLFKETKSNGIICTCREFGYFSAFLRLPTIKPSKPPRKASNTTINYNSRQDRFEHLGTHTTIGRWDSCIAFKINEDYNVTVGKNAQDFRESLKLQIADQMKIPLKVISNLFIKPGSILVTVFLVDVHEINAEIIVKDLVSRIHNGNLHLTNWNNTRLKVDPNDLKIMVIPPKAKGSPKFRFVAYATLAATLIMIALIILVILKRKRTGLGIRISRIPVDTCPIYRKFHNEFSLNGSPTTLAVYRKNCTHTRTH